MSTEKTIDISVLPEAEQDLIKALFDKCCERASQKEEKKSEPKVWKPKYCEEYHYIDGSGSIYSAIWFNTRIDNGRWNLGNVFKTQKEAEFARVKQKIKTELQRFADEHNDPDKDEWDGQNIHYYIRYDIGDEALTMASSYIMQNINDIYFTSEDVVRNSIDHIGAERIIKYLFDVDCEVDE